MHMQNVPLPWDGRTVCSERLCSGARVGMEYRCVHSTAKTEKPSKWKTPVAEDHLFVIYFCEMSIMGKNIKECLEQWSPRFEDREVGRDGPGSTVSVPMNKITSADKNILRRKATINVTQLPSLTPTKSLPEKELVHL